ncbi:MAG TPA: hypothetical protein VLG13_01255, partial [Patescibacteria group bacterium]|nr:hypothetical protein [Patescibacteria group bacterium]
KGLDKLDTLQTASPIVKTAMQHELKKKAQESFLFPYDQDGFLELESESNDTLKAVLDDFGAARREWQRYPEDPARVTAYLESANAVEAVQDEHGIFMQDEEA